VCDDEADLMRLHTSYHLAWHEQQPLLPTASASAVPTPPVAWLGVCYMA
jgi:hypothetical protein